MFNSEKVTHVRRKYIHTSIDAIKIFFCRTYIYIKHKDDNLLSLEIYNNVLSIVKERTQNKRRFSKKKDSIKKIIGRLDDIENN